LPLRMVTTQLERSMQSTYHLLSGALSLGLRFQRKKKQRFNKS